MSELKAKGKYGSHDVEATVVNPGNWFGKVWLVFVADCFDPPLYAVEADSMEDAIDEFIESDYGKIERIDMDVEGGDYGFSASPGDTVHYLQDGENVSKLVTKECWVNMKGELIEDPAKGRYISEPDVTGNGEYYDGEKIQVIGEEGSKLPWPCRYFGEGLPDEGVLPTKFEHDDDD